MVLENTNIVTLMFKRIFKNKGVLENILFSS